MGHDTPATAPTFEPLPSRQSVYTGPGWNLAQRVAFRFALVYFVLYIFPFPINTAEMLAYRIEEYATGREPGSEPTLVTKYVTKPYAEFWDEAVLRTGREVFGVEIEYRPAGSGD